MKQGFSQAADAVLQGAVTRKNGVPGVVAMATNRSDNIYEGAFGKRDLSQAAAMTTDTVLAIFFMHQSRHGRRCNAARRRRKNRPARRR